MTAMVSEDERVGLFRLPLQLIEMVGLWDVGPLLSGNRLAKRIRLQVHFEHTDAVEPMLHAPTAHHDLRTMPLLHSEWRELLRSREKIESASAVRSSDAGIRDALVVDELEFESKSLGHIGIGASAENQVLHAAIRALRQPPIEFEFKVAKVACRRKICARPAGNRAQRIVFYCPRGGWEGRAG